VSHNPYATQPPEPKPSRYIHPNRRCGCPELVHEHGCRNRYDKGCRCFPCRINAAEARRRRGRNVPQKDPQFIDEIVVERLTHGWAVKATLAEVDAAIIWLTDHGYSAREIWRMFPIPITHRRVTRARARARARLEVAA
jgi:hypothetical protein